MLGRRSQKPRAPAAESLEPARGGRPEPPGARPDRVVLRARRWGGSRCLARRLRWRLGEQLRSAPRASAAPSPGRTGPPPRHGTSSTATSPPTGASSGIDQGGDTVGEGQAYGMLLAAAIGDEKRFDAIWDWTKNNLRRPDGLISFLWSDGQRAWTPRRPPTPTWTPPARCSSPPAASTAPELRRGGAPARGRRSWPARRRIVPGRAGADGRSVGRQAAGHAEPQLLLAGHVRGAGRRVAATAAGAAWRRARAPITSTLMHGAVAPAAGLGADRGRQARADRLAGPTADAPPQFGFDAVRTLVRMAEDPDPAGRRIAARAWPVFEGQHARRAPGRARPVRPADRQHAASRRARGGGRGGRCRRPDRPPGTDCSTRPRPSIGGPRPTTAPPGWRSAGSCSPRTSLDACS